MTTILHLTEEDLTVKGRTLPFKDISTVCIKAASLGPMCRCDQVYFTNRKGQTKVFKNERMTQAMEMIKFYEREIRSIAS